MSNTVSQGDLPLLPSQHTTLTIDRIAGGDCHDNVVWALRLSGSLDVSALSRAIARVLTRHAALRACFAQSDGDWRQTLLTPATFAPSMDVVELTERSPDRDWIAEAFSNAWTGSFNPQEGGLFRVTLARVTPTEHVLMFSAHQLICDCASTALLHRELAAEYNRQLRGRDVPAETTDADFVRYLLRSTARERESSHAGLVESVATTFHRVKGQMMTPAHQPDRTRERRAATDTIRVTVPRERMVAVDEFGRQEHVTRFMVLLAVLATVLARETGNHEIVVGCPASGREDPVSRALVGPLTNLIAIGIRLVPEDPFPELLRRVKLAAREAFRARYVSLAQIARAMTNDGPAVAPLVQVMLSAADDVVAVDDAFDGLRVQTLASGVAPGRFDLSVHAARSERELTLAWCFRTDVLDRVRVEAMTQSFVSTLEMACRSPQGVSILS